MELTASEAPTPDVTGSRQGDVARWNNGGGPIPAVDRPIYSSSEVPISRINTEGVVKRIRQIAHSPPDPDAECSDELDGEEVVVVHNSIGHQSSTSPSHPPSKIFQSHLIPSTPRTFQPTSLPPASPNSSPIRPSLIPAVIPSPIVTSQQLQPVASSSRRREELFRFLPLKSFNKGSFGPSELPEKSQIWWVKIKMLWPGFFRRVDRNSRELIEYANDRTIPGTASEEMDEIFAWYEDELLNDFQRNFDHLGRDN
ncbi:hypothetical protein O181_120122 [Austropuccinia psidii MF-1]|uniref:Uncharacterized protein n=1 Tax=Austropuccinia psidii MF-1 TaxID=1389203 RepID=A0A9Q3KGG1_9BASI|nr:hypothetical protein [Austropuccinia psidii MF-1]